MIASTTAGRMPAMKSAAIDVFVMPAKTTIVMHGGIRMPIADAAEMIPIDCSCG